MTTRRAALLLALHFARADLRDAWNAGRRIFHRSLSPRQREIDSELVCLIARRSRT
jgi:hypothetical protein